MIIQDFLSLTEASDFVKSKGIDLEEWDLIFLASKGEFKVFNNIYSIPRIKESNPLYKINGLKGVFELFSETQIVEIIERALETIKNTSHIEVMDYSNGYETGLLLMDKNTKNEVILLNNAYNGLTEIRYPHASVHFPTYDGLGKQFDIISGMVESRMLEYLSERNFLNSKLCYEMLKKSLSNYYVVNTPLDHFYFKLTEIIFYPIGLRVYDIGVDELDKNEDLREIYNENDFSTIFYFRKKELETYVEKHTQNNPTNNLNLDNSLYLLGEVLNVVKSKAKKWTQGEITREILERRQSDNRAAQGLEQRTIEEYFSNANKRLKP